MSGSADWPPPADPVRSTDPWATPTSASNDWPAQREQPARPRRSWWIVALALGGGLLAGLLGGVVGFVAAEREVIPLGDPDGTLVQAPAGDQHRAAASIAGVARSVLPTVVSISSTDASGAGGTGSGFVIRSDGYIITNNHVIAGAVDGGRIQVSFSDGTTANARVVGRTPTYDIAVLKVPGRDLPTATLGDSDSLVVGDPVIAVGSPLGLAGTVTTGIVSALDRPVTAGGGGADVSFISAVQTDAAINPGNSGGPLVDDRGRVVGVNSAIATLGAGVQSGSIGLGFAIPINQASRIAQELIRTGQAEYPIVGVNLDLTYQGEGARILPRPVDGREPLVGGGPAEQAGLLPGDVITAVDGQPVGSYEEFVVLIRTYAPGDTVTLQVRRGDATSQYRVTLAASEG